MGCVIGRIHYGLTVVFCFRQFTIYHYHHNSRVITGIEKCKCWWSLSCGGVPNMLLVLSITFHFHWYIWGCMCSTGPFQFRWLRGYIHSSCYYHHQIGSINFTHYHIVSVVVCPRCWLHHILSLIAYTFRLSLLLCSLWWVRIVGYVLVCRSCSFVFILHHLIIIIVQTYLKT